MQLQTKKYDGDMNRFKILNCKNTLPHWLTWHKGLQGIVKMKLMKCIYFIHITFCKITVLDVSKLLNRLCNWISQLNLRMKTLTQMNSSLPNAHPIHRDFFSFFSKPNLFFLRAWLQADSLDSGLLVYESTH